MINSMSDRLSQFQDFCSQFDDVVVVGEGETVPIGAINQVGFFGRDVEAGATGLTIFGNIPVLPKRNRFKVISFYTSDNEYADFAERLKLSLEKFGVEYELEAVKSFGSWELNCAYKARFIKKQWIASDVPVVWLDADATVETDPILFGQIDADFAIHKWGGQSAHDQGWEFCSGTLYFGKSELAGRLIDQWLLRCEADPILWDQVHLCSAWCDISSAYPLRTFWLPRAYLQIADAPEFASVVIKHWQASRASKSDGRALNPVPFFYTVEGIESRKNNRLWRSDEERFWIAEGPSHIIPDIGHEFPEGFDLGEALRNAIGGEFPVLEFGCGVGRLASLFDKDEYIGIDVSPSALLHARRRLPAHQLRITDQGIKYPDAPTVFVYTVLLHIADDALTGYLKNIVKGRQRIIIAELMDSRWRRDGNPPVFNRDPEEYVLTMADLGYRLTSYSKHGYKRYENCGLQQDTRITFLTFDCERPDHDESLIENISSAPYHYGHHMFEFSIKPPLFHTQIGEWVDGGVKSDGQAGCLVFGPYIAVKPGRYFAKFHGHIDYGQGGVRFDVVSERGVKNLGGCVSSEFQEGICEVPFTVADLGETDVEFRVFADSEMSVFISCIEIIPFADGVAD